MDRALSNIMAAQPPLSVNEELWDSAIVAASRFGSPRRHQDGESPGEKMRRFREMINQELVSFHHTLVASPYEGDLKARNGSVLWNIGIPLTLFPKRDRGFTRVECIVAFCNKSEDNAGIRILDIYPEKRSELMAQAEMGAKLELTTRSKLGLPNPFDSGSSVADVSGAIYGKVETANLKYQAVRVCVETEIIGGCQARWRLEDPKEPERLGAESHQLAVVLEVAQGATPVEAAGYLQAYSDTRWLTSSLGSLWRDFTGNLKTLFQRGVPTESYSEWADVIP